MQQTDTRPPLVAGFFMRGRMGGMKRLRFSLRLTLLIVALAAVFFAWVGQLRQMNAAKRDTVRLHLEGSLASKELWRRILSDQLNSPHPQARAGSIATLPKVDAEIVGLEAQLKEFDR